MSGGDEATNSRLRLAVQKALVQNMTRDTINRAINLLNHEVLLLTSRFDKDDQARAIRQQQIDAKMETIIVGQEQIKRWQAVRLGIEIAAILIVVAFLYGASR